MTLSTGSTTVNLWMNKLYMIHPESPITSPEPSRTSITINGPAIRSRKVSIPTTEMMFDLNTCIGRSFMIGTGTSPRGSTLLSSSSSLIGCSYTFSFSSWGTFSGCSLACDSREVRSSNWNFSSLALTWMITQQAPHSWWAWPLASIPKMAIHQR